MLGEGISEEGEGIGHRFFLGFASARGDGSLTAEGDAGEIGQDSDGFAEVDALGFHDPVEDVALGAARPAFVPAHLPINNKGRVFVVVKRTKTLPVSTSSLERYALTDEFNDIGTLSNLVAIVGHCILGFTRGDDDARDDMRLLRVDS